MSTTPYVNDILVTTEIVAMTCNASGCGLVFGLSAEFVKARRADHRSWYCPNGHSRYYPAPKVSDEDRLRMQLRDIESQRDAARELARRENGRARAFKGHATRLRNSIAQGFCPACDTKFPDVEQHMAEQHPDFHPNVQETSQ
ncbi:MAG TPA: hypothetical protein VG497_30555 [Kribbella sp.]|nr:hypothetical protein [Kribbella sp.]